jgi:hypothetical protein
MTLDMHSIVCQLHWTCSNDISRLFFYLIHDAENCEGESKGLSVLCPTCMIKGNPNCYFIIGLKKRTEDIRQPIPLTKEGSKSVLLTLGTRTLNVASTHSRSVIFNTVFPKFSPVNIPI